MSLESLRSQVYICSTLPMQIKLVCTVAYQSYPTNCCVYLPTEIWPRCPEFNLFIEAEELHDGRSGNTSKTQWPNQNMHSLRESQWDAVSTLITPWAKHTGRAWEWCIERRKSYGKWFVEPVTLLCTATTHYFNTDRFVLIVIFPVQPERFLCHLEVR